MPLQLRLHGVSNEQEQPGDGSVALPGICEHSWQETQSPCEHEWFAPCSFEFFLHLKTKLGGALLLTSKDTNNHKINERADGQENLGELPLDVARVSVHPSSVLWWRVKPSRLNHFHLQNAVFPSF